ncbi:PBP1A family penicillin-binding protein [candidate division KSB1 bacterium]|nr:PBP1A family penicillin-binding protein [candidate division KSB1 bacterium]
MRRRITHRLNDEPGGSQQGPRKGLNVTNSTQKIWLGILAGLFLILIVFIFKYLTRDLPTLDQLERYEQALSTKIYSQDNKLIKELYFFKRTFTPLDSIPQHLVQAVLATEDREFYDHWGFNSKRFIKAMLIDLVAMRYKQGASTISQQLARDLFLSKEKKLVRKIRELLLTIQIEYTYTKNEILEMYLNHMYLGHGAYGVQAAARKYFDKKLSNLTMDESALIIALLKSPNNYSPFQNPSAAVNRRNLVLHNMLNCDFITREEFDHYRQLPIITRDFDANEEFGIAPYFTEWVRQQLQDRYGIKLYEDGLSVYTTIDTRIQACAEATVKSHLETNQEKVTAYYRTRDRFLEFLDPEYVRATGIENIRANKAFVDSVIEANATVQLGMVALDPQNGDILALIGGKNFERTKYNRVLQAHRQPGSAFKPIIFATAMDNGYSPSTEVLNQPVVLYLDNGDIWKPENYDHSEGGPTTLREGLRKSLNLVSVRVIQELVPPLEVVKLARNLGIQSKLDAVDALALGSCGITPLELTAAFGVFANKGVYAAPRAIIRVEDKYGNVLEEHHSIVREALREDVAYLMTSMMQTVIDHGTGVAARSRYQFYRPAAGKTGTTNDYTDGWFVGFTPQIVAGVWCGLDDPKMSLGRGQEGAKVALPIWAPFMKTAHDTLLMTTGDTTRWGIKDFEVPPGIVRCEICSETKKLATEFCPHILNEVFLRSTAPKSYCDKHEGYLRSTTRRRHF